MNTPQAPEEEPLSLAAHMVRALLERHGIAKNRQAAFVGDFFKLSRAAAHQRVNRSAAWTLEELSSLAQHFEETLSDVVAAHATALAKPATLRMGGASIACRIWLAEGSTDDAKRAADSYVALEKDGAYVVMPTTAIPTQAGRHIARLELVLEHSAGETMRIAVLDDEDDVAQALCDQLRTAGLEAVPYSTSQDLQEAISIKPYDGYVVDWLLAEGNAAPLLAALRAQSRPAAVVLLSGKMRNGSADPLDVASAATTYRVQVIEKPTHLPLLLSALENDGLRKVRAFKGQASRPQTA
ncbi:helix-turn-helix domain-containing protein [Variovorax sp. J22R133]|uniref:helix-turn-helix domain-containing protein n=1 Tax=Variovorax brevis TaxID=3053503 RepID=UPI0025790634|nr:helix-turn-helix domain-containing protein [Variovorax sp. J22R133]MDM0116775.1 helix-turn-helix domain-containing protein [Variovorax sp. J22R133]